jgi:hypothetical protein
MIRAVCLAAAAALLLCLPLAADDDGHDPTKVPELEARWAVQRVVASLNRPGADRLARAAAKANEVEDLALVFKPRQRKGLGIGPAPQPGLPDGIEQALLLMVRKRPEADLLVKRQDDLVRSAEVIQAVGHIFQYKTPQGHKRASEWPTFAAEMRQAGQELESAYRSRSPELVQAAARRTSFACNACHEVFRD